MHAELHTLARNLETEVLGMRLAVGARAQHLATARQRIARAESSIRLVSKALADAAQRIEQEREPYRLAVDRCYGRLLGRL